jgi:murein tripeptide amidase MpaA
MSTPQPPLPTPGFDTFPRHEALAALLHAYAAARPGLVRIEPIGRSHEGREILAVVLNRAATGHDADKPALWVDGNIHAAELTACTAVLYFLHHLLAQDGRDAQVTHLLDTRALYLVPRLNPDGAELALADRPRHIRSSTRPYPYDEDAVDGLTRQDIDGDGRVLTMRLRDPLGGYKAHAAEPRLMVAREPGDLPESAGGGPYWRLMPEGLLEHVDGVSWRVNPDREGLDLNRNFPTNWRQEFEQVGAGPYPTSEPEVRAMVDFVTRHPNIGAAVSFHTHSGVILRPLTSGTDESMIPEDLWRYQRFARLGEQMTGYPAVSVHHDFRYHPHEHISGTQDWLYEHLGALFFTVELWSPNREAGITDYKFIDWYREHPVEDDLKLLAWSDSACAGRAFVDWYAHEHPQLGHIELGGWDRLNYWRNPPPALREREASRFPGWLTTIGLALPRLELIEARAEALGGDTWRVRCAVGNAGWLPTAVTQRAVERRATRGLVFEIALPEGAELVTGLRRLDQAGYAGGPHLAGHAPRQSQQAFLPEREVTGDRALAQWVVRAPAGAVITLTARVQRAGAVTAQVTLGT